MFKDYYKILEVSRFATADEIKISYRNLAKKYHPDSNGGINNFTEIMQDINEAYNTLKNEEKRNNFNLIYDVHFAEQTSSNYKSNNSSNQQENDYERKVQEEVEKREFERKVQEEVEKREFERKVQEELKRRQHKDKSNENADVDVILFDKLYWLDKSTKLMWEVKSLQVRDQKLSFKEARIFIDKLNSEKYGGFNNWRLPSMEELQGLQHHSNNQRNCDGKLINICPSLSYATKSNSYWTGERLSLTDEDVILKFIKFILGVVIFVVMFLVIIQLDSERFVGAVVLLFMSINHTAQETFDNFIAKYKLFDFSNRNIIQDSVHSQHYVISVRNNDDNEIGFFKNILNKLKNFITK